MSHLFGSSRRSSRGRSALGLFVAVWLNLALAPCAMALQADDDNHGDHDCPHCPPAEMQGHHEMHAGMQPGGSCADDLSDCGLDDEFSHDARSGQSQLKDAQYELPVLANAGDVAFGQRAGAQQRAPPPHLAGRLPAGPPVHLLNCVFLD